MKVNRSLLANLCLALLAPTLFFLFMEAVLFLTGLKPLALTEDPYVGYSASQPLFTQQPNPDGQVFMITNPVKLTHFNSQRFPRDKPKNTYRIFSMGGSTTYGHPWRDPVSFSGWLRNLLPLADSSRNWEVINAGGISYASYREANLAAELIQYHPDLFIVYCGHNEFLEERTYRKTAGIPAWIRELSAALDHTRTFSAMRLLARKLQTQGDRNSESSPGSPSTAAAAPNPASEAATQKSGNQMAAEVDDILAKTIGPTSYTRNDTLRQGILDHYRLSLRRIADLAHSVGAEVLFVTTPANEKDCSPFKSESSPGLDAEGRSQVAHWRALAQDPGVLPSQAQVLYDSALALDPRNAALAYDAGQAAYAAQRFPEAKRLFRLALDEDICPLRALTAMHAIVLETAQRVKAPVIDFETILQQKTKAETGNEILGEPDFVDHVHLTIDNYRLIAVTAIDTLASLGILHPGPRWNEAGIQSVKEQVMAGMGPHELGEGLHNLAKVVNWAGKHEEAARIAARALKVDSMGLEAIWSSLFVGAALERQGKEDEAIPHYRHAVSLDTTNPEARHYLAGALMRAGMDQLAADEYERVLAMDQTDGEAAGNLGVIRMRLGKAGDAIPPLEATVRDNPNRADSHYLLGAAYFAVDRIPDAARQFQIALEKNPREARAWMGLGKIAQTQGNIPEAINAFSRALTLEPRLEEARAALSTALGSFGASP